MHKNKNVRGNFEIYAFVFDLKQSISVNLIFVSKKGFKCGFHFKQWHRKKYVH